MTDVYLQTQYLTVTNTTYKYSYANTYDINVHLSTVFL